MILVQTLPTKLLTLIAFLLTIQLPTEQHTRQLGQCLARWWQMKTSLIIFLKGELGVGKTTLARGFIQTFGFDTVKSPTYTLVESYQHKNGTIHHLDCYRLSDSEELEMLGIRDYQTPNVAFLVEWPQLGQHHLPPADLTIDLTQQTNQHCAAIKSHSKTGDAIHLCLTEEYS